MPTLQSLKKQLRSVRSTWKLTKAMKTVSTVKFSKLSATYAKYSEYGRRSREMFEKYGEENAEYLIEVEKSWMQHYSCAALIEWPALADPRFEEITKDIAVKQELEYLHVKGEDMLLKKLVYGEWDDSFLRAEPGQTIVYSADERLIIAE